MGSIELSEAERERWERDGFFVRVGAWEAGELARLRDAAERVVERTARAAARGGESYWVDGHRYHEVDGATLQFEHRPGSATLRVVEPFHHLDVTLGAVIDDARIVEPMRQLVGEERIALFTDKLNLKRPREGSAFGWHQDSPYWAHFTDDLERLPNVLFALDHADERNGCFRVIRGSHRAGLLPGRSDAGVLGPLFTDPRHFDSTEKVPLEVPAGGLVFFHPHCVHGSEPNRSDAPRRALVLTYQPGGRRMFRVDAKREVGTRESERAPQG